MQKLAENLVIGDVIEERRGRKAVYTEVKSLRRGGHASKLGVSSTGERLQPYSKVVVNESAVYDRIAVVTLLEAAQQPAAPLTKTAAVMAEISRQRPAVKAAA